MRVMIVCEFVKLKLYQNILLLNSDNTQRVKDLELSLRRCLLLSYPYTTYGLLCVRH